MKGLLVLREMLATPWAIMPEGLSVLAAVVSRWSLDISADPATIEAVAKDAQAVAARRDAAPARAGNGSIAVLPMYGVVTQRGNMVDSVSGPGSMSTQQFGNTLRSVLADDSIGGILIDIDSPGGSVYGVEELASEILSARAQKPIVAYANSLAASAAYWLGSQANEMWMTPSGEVGSIGVYAAHKDVSKAMENLGVKTTLISAGDKKTEGNPYEALSEEAQAYMQSRVDDYYKAFTKAVSKGRSAPVAQVRDGMGQGRVLGASQAKAAGMVDGVGSFEDAVVALSKLMRPPVPKQSSRVASLRRGLDFLGA